MQRQIARENETAEQRNTRLSNDRLQKQIVRENETEEDRNARLLNNRIYKEAARQHEDEDEHRSRLAQKRTRTAQHRSNSRNQRKSANTVYGNTRFETEESVDEEDSNSNQVSVRNSSSRRRMLQEGQLMALDQYKWPSAIPINLKEQCLEEFSNRMSMSFLRQSICIVCNSRVDFGTMQEYPIEAISKLDYLSCHPDISNVISKIQQPVHGINRELIITDIVLIFFLKDDDINSTFFSLSNAIFYKKGYNPGTKTGYICQQCHSGLNKNKIPIFSSANKMWIGDVPPVLQQLTIAEEKL